MVRGENLLSGVMMVPALLFPAGPKVRRKGAIPVVKAQRQMVQVKMHLSIAA